MISGVFLFSSRMRVGPMEVRVTSLGLTSRDTVRLLFELPKSISPNQKDFSSVENIDGLD